MKQYLQNVNKAVTDCLSSDEFCTSVEKSAKLLIDHALSESSIIFTCGNGGSGADAMHLTEELLGKFKLVRTPIRSVCLNADGCTMSCISNDFGYDQVFSRQLAAYHSNKHLLVAFSTSGRSKNVLAAVKEALAQNMDVIFLTGNQVDLEEPGVLYIKVPSTETEHIQEIHTTIFHYWLQQLDSNI